MNIRILDSVGDRATDMKQGDTIYKLIIEGFENNETVNLDFSDMKTVLSTFLNNAIGTLYKDYNSEFLNKNLKIKNLCEDDMFILRRVTKRAREFYENQQIVTSVLNDNL